MASDCCVAAGPPVVADYATKGTFEDLDGVRTYVVGHGPVGILMISDIFGIGYTQSLQMADILAGHGFSLLVPDLFHGKPWPNEKWPPKPEDGIGEWFAQHDWNHMQGDIKHGLAQLKKKGTTKFGIIAMCWGSSLALAAAGEASLEISAVANCHPAYFGQDKELATNCPCPIAIAAAEGDPMESIKEVLDTKPFASHCVYRRFDDQVHGFMGARGDFSDPHVAKGAEEAISMIAKFFLATLAK